MATGRPTTERRATDDDRAVERRDTRDTLGIDRGRQYERFGGLNWGAAFFGWLVAVGIAALLTALLSAAGAAIGLTEGVTETDARANAETISVVGAILVILVLAIAYYAGGSTRVRSPRAA
jgi:hypothetical protein